MYDKLFDTVSQIVNTYGISIFDDPKFWYILTDSYSFASDYTLRDEFKDCISTGKVSKLIALKGKKKNSLEYIGKTVKNDGRKDCTNLVVCLFSIAIALGSCSKSDYLNFIRRSSKSSSSSPSNPSSKGGKAKVFKLYPKISLTIAIGLVALFGGSLMYLWFLFGGPAMFWILCLIAIMQLGTCKIFHETLGNKRTTEEKIQAFSCYLPLLLGFIINSIIPLILMSDSIADKAFSYFSAEFVPSAYYFEPVKYDFLYRRLTPEVGFWGGLGALALCYSLINCSWKIYSPKLSLLSPRFRINPILPFIIIIIIVIGYTVIFLFPAIELKSKENEYQIMVLKNQEINSTRINKTQDLSVKGISLGISMETALGYLTSIDNDYTPSKSIYNFRLNNKDELLDKFLDLKYNRVYPYNPSSSNFDGIVVSGEQYVITTSIDNREVRMLTLGDEDFVCAIVIEPYQSRYKFENFPSLLNLYTTKYGEPEIIPDYSKEDNSIFSYENHKKTDRYIWRYKNGIIQLTEYGILYISSNYIRKVNDAFDAQQASQYKAKQLKCQQDRIIKLRNDSIKRQQELQDSLKRARNHENAINEI